MCACVHLVVLGRVQCAMVQVLGLEDYVGKSVLSLYLVAPGIELRLAGLVTRVASSLCHTAAPKSYP